MINSFIAEQLESRRFLSVATLDPTFDKTGLNSTDFANQFDTVNGAALQADGKVLVIGSTSSNSTGQSSMAVARYNADGTLDTGFGQDGSGFIVVNIAGTTNTTGIGIGELSTNKIIIAGYTTAGSTTRLFTARYNADGTADNTYGTNAVSSSAPVADVASAFLVAPNDEVYIGSQDGGSLVVEKFTTTGALDATFGTGGIATSTIAGASSARVAALALDTTTGDLVAAGVSTPTGGDSNFTVARYTAAGVLDATFASGGIFTTDFAGSHLADEADAVAVQSDGKVVAAGSTGGGLPKDATSRYAVLRLDTNGALDGTFGVGGKYTSAPTSPRYQALHAVTVLPDGHILAAGTSGDPDAPAASANAINADMSLLRLTSAGAEDTTFGAIGATPGTGEVTVDFNGQFDEARSLLVLPDGRAVVAGNVGNVSVPGGGQDFGVARVITDASAATFNASVFAPGANVAQGQNAAFALTIDHPSATDLTFTFSTSDGTGVAGTDYVAQNAQTVTIPAGSTSATITVPTLANAANTGGKTFAVTVTPPAGVTLQAAVATATVAGAAQAVVPTISVNNVTAAEPATGGTNSASFTVSLSSTSTSDVTVSYTTANVAALAGQDYTATSGTLVIPAGQTTGTINVPLLADFVAEPNESFTLTLSNPVNATLSDSGSVGIGTITDTPDTAPAATIADVSANEPAQGTTSNAVFTVTLAHPHGTDVTINYATQDGTAVAGTDYTQTTGVLTIPAGQTTGTITVPVLFNGASSANTTFTVVLSNASGATLPANPSAAATISNFTTPVLSVGNVTVSEPASGQSTTAVFTVTLDHASTTAITVNYATSDGTGIAGTDYTATSGVLTIPAGQTSGTISVPVLHDEASSANTTFTLTLSAPSGATLPATPTATGTITNTPGTPALPVATIANVTVAEPPTGGTRTAVFTVTLDKASSADVTISYSTADGTATAGSDYAATSGVLTIPAGSTTGTISVPILADTLVETDETFTVNLGNATGAVVPSGTSATGTITDTAVTVPLPVVSVGNANVTERLSDRSLLTFTVSLDQAYTEPVTVAYATADGTATAGSDYIAKSGTITIPAGQTSATVSVIIKGDVTTEQAETFTLALSSPTNATVSTNAGTGTATIADATFTTIAFTGSSKTKTTYTDASGHVVTVALSGAGSGVIYFPTGTGNQNADSIVLSGTTSKSKLTITTAKNTFTTLSSIQASGALGSITGKGVNLDGDLTVTGSLGTATLANVSGAGIPLNALFTIGGGAATGLTLAAVSDASMTFGSAPKTISVASWADSGGDADVISAPSFSTVKSNGNFNATVNATAGGINSLAAKGALNGGGATATGTIKAVSAASVTGATVSSAGADVSLASKGGVASSTVSAATQVKKLSAASLTGSTVTAGTDVTSLAVKGAISSSTVRAANNVKSVTAQQLISSQILAGVPVTTTTFPADASVFNGVPGSAIVTKVSLSAKKGTTAFSNSLIVAPNIGTASLGLVANNASATTITQGVATNVLKSATFTPASTGKAVKLANVQTGGETDGDFAVKVF